MLRSSALVTLLFLGSLALSSSAPAGSCSTGVGQDETETIDGAHNARVGFQFMKEAQKNPSLMADAIKDMQDPETMEEVQKMMQDPNFRAEVELMKQKMMQDPKMRQHMEMIKNNPEYAAQLGEQFMAKMGPGSMGGMGGMPGMGGGNRFA